MSLLRRLTSVQSTTTKPSVADSGSCVSNAARSIERALSCLAEAFAASHGNCALASTRLRRRSVWTPVSPSKRDRCREMRSHASAALSAICFDDPLSVSAAATSLLAARENSSVTGRGGTVTSVFFGYLNLLPRQGSQPAGAIESVVARTSPTLFMHLVFLNKRCCSLGLAFRCA